MSGDPTMAGTMNPTARNRKLEEQCKGSERDEAFGALISENARIGVELKRMTERAELFSGEHDAQVASKATDKVLDEMIGIIEYNGDLFQYIGNNVLPEKAVAYRFLLDEGIPGLRQHKGGTP